MSLISGTAIGAVATAKVRPATRRAHIPALPTLREVADTCPLPATYRPAFIRAARDTGLPLAMLVAVGRVESNLKPDARSSADARGLLQVLPTTAAALRLNVDRPASNVLAGDDERLARLVLVGQVVPDLGGLHDVRIGVDDRSNLSRSHARPSSCRLAPACLVGLDPRAAEAGTPAAYLVDQGHFPL